MKCPYYWSGWCSLHDKMEKCKGVLIRGFGVNYKDNAQIAVPKFTYLCSTNDKKILAKKDNLNNMISDDMPKVVNKIRLLEQELKKIDSKSFNKILAFKEKLINENKNDYIHSYFKTLINSVKQH